MAARPLARAAQALVVLAPLACAINHPANVGPSRAPANVPAGVFAPGRWSAQMAGTPPGNRGTNISVGGVTEFEVDVSPVRDSAQLVFLFGSYATPLRSIAASPHVVRRFPTDVWVEDDVVQFTLSQAMGWEYVRCRLVRHPAAGTWDGPCLASDGIKAVTLTLAVPRPKPRGDG